MFKRLILLFMLATLKESIKSRAATIDNLQVNGDAIVLGKFLDSKGQSGLPGQIYGVGADGRSMTYYGIGGITNFTTLDWINVKNFGAKGDSITDDTLAIQAAINSASTGQGGIVIYFPRGIYIISSALHLASSGQRLIIRGEGLIGSNGTIIKNLTNPNVNFFDISTPFVSDTISFYGLEFWGAGKGTGIGNAIVLGSTGTTVFDSIIQNCWFVNIPSTCIKGIRIADYRIIMNGIEGSDKGIVIDNTALNGGNYLDRAALNAVFGNTFYSLNTAILFQFGYGTRINNNVFNFCGTDTATNAAIVIERLGTNVETRNTIISGNVFDRNWNDIYLHGDGALGAHTGVSGVLVENNISDFANRSFALIEGANECIFIGNKVNDCSANAILYPAFNVIGSVTRPGFFNNVVTRNGSFGPTYGLFCDTNVSQINLGHNRWFGNTSDIRIEGTIEANGDIQASAVGMSIGYPFGAVDLPMGYQWGIYGTNGFVAGAAGNIKITGTGKQTIIGYDFGLDSGILRSVNQGVAYKQFNIDGSPILFNQNSGAYSDFQVIRVKGNSAPSTGKGLELGYNSGTTNGSLTTFDRDNGLYTRMSLDGLDITLNPHSTLANVGIGVPIGTKPSDRLQIISGNIALDNNTALKFKDIGGIAENNFSISNNNNLMLFSPSSGGSLQLGTRATNGQVLFYSSNQVLRLKIDETGNYYLTLTNYNLLGTDGNGKLIPSINNLNYISNYFGKGTNTEFIVSTDGSTIHIHRAGVAVDFFAAGSPSSSDQNTNSGDYVSVIHPSLAAVNNSMFNIVGSYSKEVDTYSASWPSSSVTIDRRHNVIVVTYNTGTFTVNLPKASICQNREYVIKRGNTGQTVTVSAFAGDVIDGNATMSLTSNYQSITVISDGVSSWWTE